MLRSMMSSNTSRHHPTESCSGWVGWGAIVFAVRFGRAGWHWTWALDSPTHRSTLRCQARGNNRDSILKRDGPPARFAADPISGREACELHRTLGQVFYFSEIAMSVNVPLPGFKYLYQGHPDNVVIVRLPTPGLLGMVGKKNEWKVRRGDHGGFGKCCSEMVTQSPLWAVENGVVAEAQAELERWMNPILAEAGMLTQA